MITQFFSSLGWLIATYMLAGLLWYLIVFRSADDFEGWKNGLRNGAEARGWSRFQIDFIAVFVVCVIWLPCIFYKPED